ncbi:MAG: hypothetical protein NTZ38_03275 [Candidatus Taylorbacteria bacterium]|nr:hypothetical protein [Candidatus Taylorbacteria bacterium]
METKFQTSFIPKKTISGGGGAIADLGISPTRPKHPTSIFLDVAIFLFIVSIGAAGAMYAWKSYVLSSQNTYKEQLAKRQSQFNPSLIEELKRANVKIDVASSLISNHTALSNIFDIISHITIEDVRFMSLDVSSPMDKTNEIKISLSGYGTNLKAVAFQSDVLADLSPLGLTKIVKNPVLSDPSTNDTSKVSFGFSASLNSKALLYTKTLGGIEVNDSILSATSSSDVNP